MDNYKVGDPYRDSNNRVLGIVSEVCENHLVYTNQTAIFRQDGLTEYHTTNVSVSDERVIGVSGDFVIRGRNEPLPVGWE